MSEDIHYTYVNDFDIKIYKLRKKYYRDPIFLSFKILKICKNEKPDIINVWGILPALNLYLSKLVLKIKIINCSITEANPNLKFYNLLYIITKLTYPISDLIISNSQNGLLIHDVPIYKSLMIRNGVNLERFNFNNLDLKKYEFVKIKKFNLVMIARFNKNKNHKKLFEFYKKLKHSYKDISLTLIGSGELEYNIREMIEVMKLEDIQIFSNINDIENLAIHFDLGLLFTFSEGIPNSIIELMALGIPLIADEVGGVADLIDDGINGYLTTNKSDDEILTKLVDLLENSEKYNYFKKNSIKKIYDYYDIKIMGNNFINVFKRFN